MRTPLDEAIAALTDAAGVIDALCATSSPSIELLEASLAVHKALVALVDGGGDAVLSTWAARPMAPA
jgi:hypothetical protein